MSNSKKTETPGTGVEGLRPCKRYITGHDTHGKSIYLDSPEQVFRRVPMGGMARSYSVSSVPANLTDEADVKAYKSDAGPTSYSRPEIVCTSPGPNILVVDFAPGTKGHLHRTVSIDYSICVDGELDHALDGGEVVRLKPGDHIIQRGTMHSWSNASTEKPARLVAVSIPCVPFDIAGQALKETHLPAKAKL